MLRRVEVAQSCPTFWNSSGQNTGVGSLSLLQGIFPTQGSNPGLPHCGRILYPLNHQGSPRILEWVAYPFSRGSSQPRNRNQGLLHCRRILYQLSYEGSPVPGKLVKKRPREAAVKCRDITLPTKVRLVKAMVFPVVMYGYESWTIKKAEHRIDAFELWCWRRLLRVPWTARTSNQSILKEISPEYSLEGVMLKLKLQYFGHLMQRTDSFEKTLMLERLKAREADARGWDGWMASPKRWTWVWVNSGSWWWTGRPGVLQSMESQSRTRLSNWTDWTEAAGPEWGPALTVNKLDGLTAPGRKPALGVHG